MKNYFLSILLTIFLVPNFYSQHSAEQLNDSAMKLYKEDPQKAIGLLEKASKIAESVGDFNEYYRSKNHLAIVYVDLGEFEKAKSLSQEAFSKAKDSMVKASALNNIGRCNRGLGLYEEALKSYLQALKIYESQNNLIEQATVNDNIGMVYSFLGMNAKAIDYHLKSKQFFEKINDKKGISKVYNNIAIIYANDGNLEEALQNFKYSLSIEKELKDKKGMAESANNVGAVFYYMQKIDSALVYFRQSAMIEKAIGNFAGVGTSYNNIAQVLIENNRVDESKKFIDSAYYFANQSKTAVDIEAALELYSQYYEAKNDTKTALKYFKEYATFKDSILNFDTNAKVAKLEIEYQTEKKEKEILSQRANLAEKELDLSKKNTYIFGLIGLAVALSLLGFLFYNQQKLKNRQLQKENELKDALLKIETQNRLQEQRLRISRDLHDNIGAQLTFIISSLDNLKYGFQLPEKLSNKLKTISDFTTTTIYELRDTIWAMNKSEISLEDLQTRISNFIDKANTASDTIDFTFIRDTSLSNETKFSSVEGMNLYRIIQEAINNSLKYAEATTIKVQFKTNIQDLEISILDNGKGFDQTTIELGNGLNNMKKRAHDINASISIDSKPNKGTTVSIQLPLKIYDK